MIEKELVMYGRRFACSDQMMAQHFLEANAVPYRFVDIGTEPGAAQRLIEWTGHQSVPTLLIAKPGELLPVAEPEPLPGGKSARGLDRDTLITEPSNGQLEAFLKKHDLL